MSNGRKLRRALGVPARKRAQPEPVEYTYPKWPTEEESLRELEALLEHANELGDKFVPPTSVQIGAWRRMATFMQVCQEDGSLKWYCYVN